MRHLADWKLWVSFTVALMVAYIVFVGYSIVEDNRLKGDRLSVLGRSQQTLLTNQALLLAELERVERRQDRLLRLLRAQGVEVPEGYELPGTSTPAPRSSPRKSAATEPATKPAMPKPATKPAPKPAPPAPPSGGKPTPEPICVLTICLPN